MPTVINNRSSLATDPLRNFRFLVIIKPHQIVNGALSYGASAAMGFTSVSGLSVTTNSIPYREGGYNTTVHQVPGQTSFSPITLQRGVTLGTNSNWNWMKTLFRTVEGGTTAAALDVTNNFRADIEIQVLSHPIAGSGGTGAFGVGTDTASSASNDHIAMRFNVYNAWITSIAYSDLNAGDNSIYVEQMTLVHEGFDLNWASSLSKSAATF